MIRVYQRTDCPFCWKLRLALVAHGIDYQSIDTQLGEKHPDVVQLSPKGSVPVLVDGDLVIWESGVALEYLNERYAKGCLFSASAEENAWIRLLHNYSDTVVGPALRDQVFEKRAKPESEWDKDKIRRSDVAWRTCLDTLEGWFTENKNFGPEFSAAECALLPRFGVAGVYGAGVDQRHPVLLDWFESRKQSDAYQKAYPTAFIGRS